MEIYKKIMREYERQQQLNQSINTQHKQQVYAKNARLKQIDDELMRINIRLSKMILHNENNLDDLRKQSELLNAERKMIFEMLKLQDDYFDVCNCKVCKDTGYVQNTKCNCFKQKLIQNYYAMSNLENVLQNENFDTFDIRYYDGDEETLKNIQMIYKTCLDFVETFGVEFSNLLFYGQPGLGKTFLCNCIAKEILDRGLIVFYLTSTQLFKLISEIYFKDNNEHSEMLLGADLLIIDDLGTEYATLPLHAELFNIINTRLLNKKPIIISTNLQPHDLEKQYSSRIFSRLIGNYTFLKFIGNDIRLLKKHK